MHRALGCTLFEHRPAGVAEASLLPPQAGGDRWLAAKTLYAGARINRLETKPNTIFPIDKI